MQTRNPKLLDFFEHLDIPTNRRSSVLSALRTSMPLLKTKRLPVESEGDSGLLFSQWCAGSNTDEDAYAIAANVPQEAVLKTSAWYASSEESATAFTGGGDANKQQSVGTKCLRDPSKPRHHKKERAAPTVGEFVAPARARTIPPLGKESRKCHHFNLRQY